MAGAWRAEGVGNQVYRCSHLFFLLKWSDDALESVSDPRVNAGLASAVRIPFSLLLKKIIVVSLRQREARLY